MKCTLAIRQLAYDTVPDALDEYLQIGPTTSRLSLENFYRSIIEIFGPEFLRKPLMLKGYTRLMDMTHFFGVVGSNKDINVIHRSPLLNDLKLGKAPEIPFVANDVTYPWGYYLYDGIYQEWVPFVKSVTNLADDDYKRLQYKTMHEATRKDVERAFGVLKKK
ncbi:ALP1-like protein [Tanacetum coccineum]